MFQAKIESKKLFEPFENFAQFIDESSIKLTKEGLSAIASDRAMVCVIEFKIPASEFERFELDKDTFLSLNITNFVEILKRKTDFTTLSLDENNRLIIEFDTRKFTIPQLELSSQEIPEVNKLDKFTAKVQLKTEIFSTAIKDSDINSDSMVVQTKENGLIFFASGDVQSNDLLIEKGNENLYSLEGNGKGRYPLEYLKKLKIKTEKISLDFGVDYPLLITFNNFKMTLAPRVDENE